ncbi:MAG: YicC family protein [Desulfobulbaceae bacterium]|nr:MAG: YicC family protein [Desulfobulbaceae bacterium]
MSYPRSMTGFGRADHQLDQQTWSVEIKSVNHRYCDIKIKMPRQLYVLEDRIKKEIAKVFSRGHVDVIISGNGTMEGSKHLEVDHNLADQYRKCLEELGSRLESTCTADTLLTLISSYPQVIRTVEAEEDSDTLWRQLQPAIVRACENSLAMREAEGANLKKDLLERLALFAETVEEIKAKAPELLALRSASLEEKINSRLEGIDIDPARLAQELVILADKADVTEEVVRLDSHISQFRTFLEADEAVGRRLDFLLQEFLREINTLASKISTSSVAHQTVELKNEMEKMREQVQNLE